MKKALAIAFLAILAVAGLAAQQHPKAIYKVTRLSVNTVAISCDNGGDPATFPKQYGLDALIVSCGR